MLKSRFSTLVFLVLIACGLGLLTYQWLVRHTTTTQETKLPVLYATEITVWKTDATGRQEMKIRSRSAQYFQNKTTTFTEPRIILYPDNGKPSWNIRSDAGKAFNDGEKIILKGHVHAHQAASEHQLATTITTTQASVFPRRKLVTTQSLVTLEQAGLKIQAKGVHADLKTNQIKLSEQVEAEYNPKAHKTVTETQHATTVR